MILFYSEKITPRVEYIAKLYFEQILKVKVLFTSEPGNFLNSDLPKINYSEKLSAGGIYLKPHSLLFETEIKKQKIDQVEYKGQNLFFGSSSDSFVPFDLFAAAFFLVTRYEEYIPVGKDDFGRYRAENSILYEYNLLKKPVINIWAQIMAGEISKMYPNFNWPERNFRFLSTVDVDNAWAFRHKGFGRTAGALTKALLNWNFRNFLERIKVLAGIEKDPYDNYSFLDSVFAENEDKVIFFFLLGNHGKYDKGISFKNRHFVKLISDTSKKYRIGIHPSFASAEDESGKILMKEKIRLEEIANFKVEISRQHYLNVSFPATFRKLIASGIKKDFSLGYPSQIGFRAGICSPFFFYDLERDAATDLNINPFQVMDVTLQQYLEFNPEKAWEEIQKMMTEVKEVKGTFVSVWHNESVSDLGHWKGYRNVFEKMNRLGFRWARE